MRGIMSWFQPDDVVVEPIEELVLSSEQEDYPSYEKPAGPPKRGEKVKFLRSAENMQLEEGVVLLSTTSPEPHCLFLALVQTKQRLFVIIKNDDFLKMADDVRSVEMESVATAENYLSRAGALYMSTAEQNYGGKNGFGLLYVAKRLWAKFSPRPITAKDIIL